MLSGNREPCTPYNSGLLSENQPRLLSCVPIPMSDYIHVPHFGALPKVRALRFHRRPGFVVDVGEPLVDFQVGRDIVTLLSRYDGPIYRFFGYQHSDFECGQPLLEIGAGIGRYATHKIFMAYRQADDPGSVGRLFERLSADFGRWQLFLDIYSLRPGEDYTKQLDVALSRAELLIVVVGNNWLVPGRDGKPRIGALDDTHRHELATAIQRGIPILPITIEGARMPASEDLPEDIAAFSKQQALAISHRHWHEDAQRLFETVYRLLPNHSHISEYRRSPS